MTTVTTTSAVATATAFGTAYGTAFRLAVPDTPTFDTYLSAAQAISAAWNAFYASLDDMADQYDALDAWVTARYVAQEGV